MLVVSGLVKRSIMKNDIGIDKAEVKRQQEAEEDFQRIQRRRIADLRKLLKQPEFRRFIWHILSETGIFKASFTLNSMQTAFLEGRRDVGLAFIEDLDKADTNALIQIRQEYVSEIKAKEAAIKNQEDSND